MTTPHPAIAAGLIAGAFAVFKGYGETEEGQVLVLTKGDAVKVVRLEGDEDIIVCKVDTETGAELTQVVDGADTLITERLFAEELTLAKLEAPAAPVADAAPAKRGRGKAADEPAAEKPLTAAQQKKADAAAAKAAAAETKAADKAAAAATKAAAAAAKKDVAPVASATFDDTPSVKALIEGGDALNAALSLVNQAEATDFTLGGVLHNIHETGIYKTLGYDGKRGFDDYVEQTLGLASRKGRYLMTTYVAFASLGIDETKLAEIGWSKAKELARIPGEALKKDFDKLVKLAGTKTREELIAHITTKYTVATRGSSVKTTSFNFRLAEEDGETVKAAIAQAKALAGENADDNRALVYMAGDWMNNAAGSDMTMQDMIGLIETTFGVTVAVSTTDGTVIEDVASFVPAVAEEASELVPA